MNTHRHSHTKDRHTGTVTGKGTRANSQDSLQAGTNSDPCNRLAGYRRHGEPEVENSNMCPLLAK